VQVVGIAVAAAVVVLLLIALLVTRRRGGAEAAPPAHAEASFLDAAPQDTLEALGRAEEPVEDVTLDPAATRELREAASEATLGAVPAGDLASEASGHPLSLDWGPSADEPQPHTPGSAGEPSAGEPSADRPPAVAPTLEEAPEAAAADRPADETAVSADSGETGAREVPLSDIIVTTSRKVIDLDDPEVRRMLTDLIKFEIDQATRYREQGQDIDAVLQLTEAEKISRALGMNESAAAIHEMIQDLQRRV
jgi:hypothetical protein